jgi:hypothetical protein
MFTYKLTPVYSHKNGKLVGHEKEQDKLICDYSGVEYDDEARRMNGLFADTIQFEHDHGSEQSWYYDNVDELICILAGKDISEIDEVDNSDDY